MKTRTVFEIVGTIALLATLFSSVGFSGWTYGDNLILNPNLTEANLSNSSFPANWGHFDWDACGIRGDLPNASFGFWNNTEGYWYINKSVTSTFSGLASSWFNITKGQLYYMETKFKSITENGVLRASFYFTFDIYGKNDSNTINACYNDMNLVSVAWSNTTFSYYNGTFGNSTNNNEWLNTTLTALEDGWFKISGYWNSSVSTTIKNGSHLLSFYSYGAGWTEYIDYVYFGAVLEIPDNFTIVNNIFPSNSTSNSSNNIFLGYELSTSNPSPSCSLYLDNIFNQTNNSVLNGSLNTFVLDGLANASYDWYVNCTAGGMSNVSNKWSFTVAKAYPPALNLSIGLSEPVDGTRSMESPIVFSYAVLSNYDVLNCSLVTDTIYHGGGWSVRQTNQTPIVTGGTLNYFQLSGMQTKDTFVWTVACTTAFAPNVQYLAGNRTYIYDPMYAGGIATNILRLAPILLGLFVVLMTFVWVMNRESEELLGVLLHMFVLYIVLAVMLVIIFSIL